jgi:hypothetical protein
MMSVAMENMTLPFDRDVCTAEGWSAYLTDVQKRVADFAILGESPYVLATLYLRRHPMTGAGFNEPRVVIVAAEGDSEGFRTLLRAIAICGDAIAALWTAEVWGAIGTSENFREGIRPRDQPDRFEGIAITAEHRELAPHGQAFMAIIEGETPPRAIGPWASQANLDQQHTLLPPAGTPEFFQGEVAAGRALLQQALYRGVITPLDLEPLSKN